MPTSLALSITGAKIRNTKWHLGHLPHQSAPWCPASLKFSLQLENTWSKRLTRANSAAIFASE